MNVDSDGLLSPDHFPLPPSNTPMEPIVFELLASESNPPSQDDSFAEQQNPPDAGPPTPEGVPNDNHKHQPLETLPVVDLDEHDMTVVEDALASRSRSATPDNDTGLGDEPSFALAERVLSACGNPSPPPQTAELPDEAGSAPGDIAHGGAPLERSDSRQSSPVPVTNESETLEDNAPLEGPSAPSRSTFDFVFPVNVSVPVDNDMDVAPVGPSRSSREHTPEPLLPDTPAILEPSSSGRRRSARLSMKREKIELEALALGLESPDTGLESRASPQPTGDLFQQASPSKSRTSPRKQAKSTLSILDAPQGIDHTPDVAMDSPPQSPRKSRSPVKGKGKSRASAAWHPEETGMSFMSVFRLDSSIPSDVFYGNGYTSESNAVQPSLSSQDAPSLPSMDSAQPSSQLDENTDSDQAKEEEILEALDSVHVTPPRERAAKRRTSIDKALLAANVQRPPLPKTPSKSGSPEKASLGPQRTPARRVTMEEAIADGSISPAKAASMASKTFGTNIVRPPVFIRPALDDPQRSPAGKGLLAQKHQSEPQESEKKERTTVQRPPPSRPSKIPNTKIIKPPLKSTVIKNRGLLRPPPASSSSSAKPQNQTTLPFPLSPTKPSAAKPAGSGTSSSSSRGAASRSTAVSSSRPTRPKVAPAGQTGLTRSTLKEPTLVTSKIPRIEVKPYARASSTVKPSRPVKSDSSIVVKKIANLALTPKDSSNNEEPVKDDASSEEPVALQKAFSKPPKLKTEPEKQDAHPVDPVLRPEDSATSQVVPMSSPPPSEDMVISPEIRSAPMPSPGPSEQMVISPVVDQSSLPSLGAPLASEAAGTKASTSADHEETTKYADQRSSKRGYKDDEGELALSPSKRMRRNISLEPSSPSSSPPPVPASARHTSEVVSGTPALASSNDVDSQDEFEGRRMTRTRTSFARTGQTVPRPAVPSRRRARAPAVPDPLFAGLDPVALKALTNTNTTRNQCYLSAQIEVLLVRKEGRRPDSPTVKVKTMMQKEKEDRMRERSERAARRARRSDGFDSDAGEAEEPGPQHSPLRHRFGAGDEEEYMSPLRAQNPEKAPKKHVKWNHGLFSVVHLDEIVPQPNKPAPVDKSSVKGILSETIKTTELDRMGNHPLAEVPLNDLPQERVVVQHFLYEDDQQALPPPPPPDPIPPKVTRSKGKKAKS